uniref:Uncharacterized protein n=1 Tax=Rhizophora mucronata TaxID=61149 RepID=A0A2P2QT99_RHIMU
MPSKHCTLWVKVHANLVKINVKKSKQQKNIYIAS